MEPWDVLIRSCGQILEPLDLRNHCIDPAFRDRTPPIVKGENGRERLIIDEYAIGDGERGIGGSARSVRAKGCSRSTRQPTRTGKPGGFDPHKRIPDMDADGIVAAFLYPGLGLLSRAIEH
jgi:uncharacterized protein